MTYNWDFSFLDANADVLLRGLAITILYTIVTIALGCAVGLLLGLARLVPSALVRLPVRLFVEVFRCTPLLVQLIWFYYAFPVLIGVQMPAYMAATLALTLYGAAFYSEIFRGGVLSIERGQWDAARGLGMGELKMMTRIILPQAFKVMIPPFMNQSVMQLKNTSLISTLAVADLVYQGTIIAADTYRPLEVYTVIAVVYFALLFPMTTAAEFLERKLAVSS
jgi:polar amino acid transport system permease protein